MSQTPAPEANEGGADPRHGRPLHQKILIGLLVGATLGLLCNWLGRVSLEAPSAPDVNRNGLWDTIDFWAVEVADPIGKIFLRLVMMVVIPLIFSALSLGMLELGDVRRLGRVGLRTLIWTAVLSASAVAIGLTIVNVFQPGRSLTEEQQTTLRAQYSGAAQKAINQAEAAKPVKKLLLDIIPENPLQEMVGALDGSSPGNGMLAVMFCALTVGLALTVAGPRVETLVKFLEGMFDVSMTIIGFAMRIAPVGVACLIFSVTAQIGFDILKTLAWFVVTVLIGMTIQVVVVYSLAVWVGGRRPPLQFFRDIAEAMLTAFGTSSSNATLPTSLRVARDKLHLPHDISQFVLTIGSTANQNGTALYEGVVVLFLAQVFGIHLDLQQQLTVVLMSVLAGVGTAGVPGGSIPMIVIVLKSVGMSGDEIGIILGIDRVLDMCRTVLNVSGDLVLATCVSRGEREAPAPVVPA
ncbi:MAG: dicarboxylate/amino acid:cation symporter [Planctomycetes bacterium]|nr:dicarboxylate/amino acid:cation symporter [Planctomycetota bacterium]